MTTEFQSTRPVWGATTALKSAPLLLEFQSTRPVWGATHLSPVPSSRLLSFNPRAPCGARLLLARVVTESLKFQSTRPVWGATEFRIVGVVL